MSIDVETMKLQRMIQKSALVPDDELTADFAPQQSLFVPFDYNVIYGSNLDDKIVGTFGSDMVFAAGGNDTVTGGGSSDILDGESGNDELWGGSGNDQVLGDLGNDTMNGGSGNDKMLGGDGNDVFDGGAGNNWIEGGDGDDLLTGSYGGNVLKGGNGGDLILGYADMINEMWGGAGNDDIGGSGVIHGEDGNDFILAGMFDDTIWCGADDDLVQAAEGNDLVFGEDGDDTLMGYEGDDIVEGGTGDDTIYGDFDAGSWTDGGSDTLSGNAGSDTFVYFSWGNGGADMILDFEIGVDVLRLADLVDENDDGVIVGNALDGDLLLSFANGASVEFEGLQNPGIATVPELAQFIAVDFG